jgi:hypothetical protein
MVAFIDGGIGDCPKITGSAEINDCAFNVPNLTLRLQIRKEFYLLMDRSRTDGMTCNESSVRRLETADRGKWRSKSMQDGYRRPPQKLIISILSRRYLFN